MTSVRVAEREQIVTLWGTTSGGGVRCGEEYIPALHIGVQSGEGHFELYFKDRRYNCE